MSDITVFQIITMEDEIKLLKHERDRLNARVRRLTEALEFIANDLDMIGITPTECSHLAKARNALKDDT